MSHVSKETKEYRFRRLAEDRVNKILNMLRLLGNLSNTGNYVFTQEQVEQIFSALQTALIDAKKRFYNAGKPARKRFSLSEPYDSPEEKITKQSFTIQLPDGTFLRAVGCTNDNYPGIGIYWDNGRNHPEDAVCYVEFNPDREGNQRVCIGAYQEGKEETTYCEPYIPEPKQWEVKTGEEDGKPYQYLVPKGTPVPGEKTSMEAEDVLKEVRSLPNGGGVL